MNEFVAISLESHFGKSWLPVTDYAFSAKESALPVTLIELAKVVPAMPMGFVEVQGGYQLVALTSLNPGTNLYVAPDGRWLVPYIPAVIRAYPFALSNLGNTEKVTLCINESSGRIVDGEADGLRFFGNDGEPTDKIKKIITFLSELETNRAVTQKAVNALAKAKLLTPWELKLRHDGGVVPVNGVFRINEEGLAALSIDDLQALREAGGLPIAYGQLFSMHQLAVLERLGQVQGQLRSQSATNFDDSTLTGFTLSNDDGTISFD